MEQDFKQIVKIERECHAGIVQAEQTNKEKLNRLRQELEDKKNRVITDLIEKNKNLLTKQTNRTNAEIRQQLDEIRGQKDLLIKDTVLCSDIKNQIINIILETKN